MQNNKMDFLIKRDSALTGKESVIVEYLYNRGIEEKIIVDESKEVIVDFDTERWSYSKYNPQMEVSLREGWNLFKSKLLEEEYKDELSSNYYVNANTTIESFLEQTDSTGMIKDIVFGGLLDELETEVNGIEPIETSEEEDKNDE